MKKLLMLFCALLLLFPAVPSRAADASSLRIVLEDAACKPGGETCVAVRLEQNPGLASVRLLVGYDAARLHFVSAELMSEFEKTEDLWLAEPVTRGGKSYVALSWVCASGQHGEARFAALRFRSLNASDSGSVPLTLSATPDDLFGADLQNVAYTLQPGSIIFSSLPIFVRTEQTADGLSFQAENLGFDDAQPLQLIAAFYDPATGRQQMTVVAETVIAGALEKLTLIAHGQDKSAHWKLFVLDAQTHAPLCAPYQN